MAESVEKSEARLERRYAVTPAASTIELSTRLKPV
jgi:hypothetical protein